MGQLGYGSKVIIAMPKDREGYPFQPNPLEILEGNLNAKYDAVIALRCN
jgi:hypothetical protein